MLKTRRQQRYIRLRNAGFLPFEARPLSKVPQNIPYVKQMISSRRELLKQAIQDKRKDSRILTQKAWAEQIKKTYTDNVLTRVNKRGDIVLDPWQLLRQREDAYILKHPEYESPWQKRGQRWRDFISKWERTVELQETTPKPRRRQHRPRGR